MDTIMHIVYMGTNKKSGLREKSSGIRLVVNASQSHLRLLDGVTKKLQVVHSAPIADVLSASARTIAEIVRTYEDRIYKRLPGSIY